MWSAAGAPDRARVRLRDPWLPFTVAAGAALCGTLTVLALEPVRLAYPAPSLRVALDTGVALIGLFGTAIVVRGWRDRARLDQLAIAAGLAVLAVTTATLTTLLAIAPGTGPRGV